MHDIVQTFTLLLQIDFGFHNEFFLRAHCRENYRENDLITRVLCLSVCFVSHTIYFLFIRTYISRSHHEKFFFLKKENDLWYLKVHKGSQFSIFYCTTISVQSFFIYYYTLFILYIGSLFFLLLQLMLSLVVWNR